MQPKTHATNVRKRAWRTSLTLALGGSVIIIVAAWHTPRVATVRQMAACSVKAPGEHTSDVPDGAPWREARILRSMPPPGYSAGAAWLTAATTTPCLPLRAHAQIDIAALRVVGVQRDGTERIVFEADFARDGNAHLDAGLYTRYPTWFATDRHTPLAVSTVAGAWTLDLARYPYSVIHAWTPRFAVTQGVRYVVEARVRVSGAARLQFGLDFWRDFRVTHNGFDEFCRGTNNCEAHVGPWIGDTHGAFMTVRSVSDQIAR